MSVIPQITSQVQKLELPLVSEKTQNSVNFQINLLKLILPTYNWLFCNKQMLYRVVVLASQNLHQAAEEMKLNKGNYLDGTGNIVAGRGNVVIGSNNALIGVNSWCFTSDYQTSLNKIDEGILALGNFKVVLSKANLILTDPMLAISMIDSSEL